MFSDGIFKTGGILGHRMPPAGDRHVSSNGRPLSPGLRLVSDFPPSGVLAGGVGGRGIGPGTGLGRGMGRGLGPGSGGLIVQDKTMDSSYGGRGTTPFVHAAGQPVRPNRPFNDDLELPDEDIFNRESKRVRLGGGFPQSPAENPVMSPRFDGQRLMPPNARHLGPSPDGSFGPYANGPGPRLNSVPVPFDGPRPLPMVPGSGATGPAPTLSHSIGINVGVKRSSVSSEGRLGVINEGWKWQGLVAKGGTPVCHARCFPVGKGIDIDLPDVINCTARTDLDMLAKHVYQAGDYGVVFFVPDGDVDVTPYQDFMRYLGEKHRAGVAKLSNGSTLFLVPPSEFSEGVLKVPGNNCLFGVVLKFQQQSVTYMQAPPPRQQLPQQQPQTGFQQQMPYPKPPPQDLAVLTRVADQASQPGQGVMATTTSQLIPAHLANIPLTPELIASLTALLPQRSSATLPSNLIVGPSLVASGVNVVDATMGRAPSLGPVSSLINLAASALANESQSFPTSQNNPPLPSQLWPYSQQDQSASSRGSFVAQSSGSLTLPPLEPSPRLQPQPPSQPQPAPHAQPQPQHQRQHQPQSHPHPPLPPLPPPPPQQSPQVHLSHLSATQQPSTGIVSSLGQGFSQALATGLLSGPPFSQLSAESSSGQVLPQQLLSTGHLPMPTEGLSVPQSQGYLGSGSSGQYLQQPRPSLSATVAPQLPADQLAQLTALLTQRQQQPAQQQAAQVLQQHYQQQQPTGTLQQPQTSDVQGQQTPQNQQQLFSQQLQFSAMPQGAQPGWEQGGQGVQQQSQPIVHAHGVSWEGALPRSQEHGVVSGVEQQQWSSAQDADQETERQKRFQATLHLAAALLQQMQQPPKNPDQQ
ncbi:hypothetical protein O6H91_03G045700 [Diphasiastrum complanatum]|nr:hypothetical protein O6H91_03G045700 [Diphasiastrum complanatum]